MITWNLSSPDLSQLLTDMKASLVAQLVKNPLVMQETLVQFLGQEDPLEKQWTTLPTPVFLGFPCGSDGKESACNVRDLGSIPGLGRSPGGSHGNSLQYSCLENPHGQRSWRAPVHAGWQGVWHTERLSTAQHSTGLCLFCLTGIPSLQRQNASCRILNCESKCESDLWWDMN